MKKQHLFLVTTIAIILVASTSFASFYFWKLNNKSFELNSKIALTSITNNGCQTDQKYDSIEKECYYECDVDCGEDDAKLEGEIDALLKDVKIKGTEDEKSETDKEQKTTYLYNNGDLEKDIVDPSQKQAWDYFLAIATREFAKENVALVSFFNNPKSDTMASVNQNEKDNKKWDLEINMKYGEDKKELVYTLVHEFGHIYSLNKNQINPEVSDSCSTVKLDEGCANPESFLAQYQNKFWSSIDANPNTNEYGQHYQKRETSFVSEYAGTNVIEDFAETFAIYAVKDDSEFTDIAKDKINFMDSNPNIKKTAIGIRSNLGRELKDDKVLN